MKKGTISREHDAVPVSAGQTEIQRRLGYSQES